MRLYELPFNIPFLNIHSKHENFAPIYQKQIPFFFFFFIIDDGNQIKENCGEFITNIKSENCVELNLKEKKRKVKLIDSTCERSVFLFFIIVFFFIFTFSLFEKLISSIRRENSLPFP